MNLNSDFRPGILSNNQLRLLVEKEVIIGYNKHNFSGFPEDCDIDESSFDLHLGDEIWEMEGGVKCAHGQTYGEVLKHLNSEKIKDEGKNLEPKKTYVIEIQEKINFYEDYSLYGYATGRSSIGRLDVLTRLIADYSEFYDELPCPRIIKDR